MSISDEEIEQRLRDDPKGLADDMVRERVRDMPQSVLLQRGRYALEQAPDGSWFILRATPICEACESCGCGEQQEPLTVPSWTVNLLNMDPEQRAKVNPLKMLKGLMNGGS